ncbi:MAG: SRPBCC family protein [Rhodoferax sp.]
MKTFAHFVTIYAPRARIWDVLSDLPRWPERMASVDNLQRQDDAALGVGSRVRIKQPGLPAALWTITAWKPGKSFTWQSRSIGLSATARHRIVDAQSACQLELRLQLEGWLAPVISVLVGRTVRRHLAIEGAAVKQASEALQAG